MLSIHRHVDTDPVADRENPEGPTVQCVYERDTLKVTKASKMDETRSVWQRTPKAETLPMLFTSIEKDASFLEASKHGGGWSTDLQLPKHGLLLQPGAKILCAYNNCF